MLAVSRNEIPSESGGVQDWNFSVLKHKEVKTLEYLRDLGAKVHLQTGIFDDLSRTSSRSKTDVWR